MPGVVARRDEGRKAGRSEGDEVGEGPGAQALGPVLPQAPRARYVAAFAAASAAA